MKTDINFFTSQMSVGFQACTLENVLSYELICIQIGLADYQPQDVIINYQLEELIFVHIYMHLAVKELMVETYMSQW